MEGVAKAPKVQLSYWLKQPSFKVSMFRPFLNTAQNEAVHRLLLL
jgi:hypothetical protein